MKSAYGNQKHIQVKTFKPKTPCPFDNFKRKAHTGIENIFKPKHSSQKKPSRNFVQGVKCQKKLTWTFQGEFCFGFPHPFYFSTAEVNDECIGTCGNRQWKAGSWPLADLRARSPIPISSYFYFWPGSKRFLFRPHPPKVKFKNTPCIFCRFRVWDSLWLQDAMGFQTLGAPSGAPKARPIPGAWAPNPSSHIFEFGCLPNSNSGLLGTFALYFFCEGRRRPRTHTHSGATYSHRHLGGGI